MTAAPPSSRAAGPVPPRPIRPRPAPLRSAPALSHLSLRATSRDTTALDDVSMRRTANWVTALFVMEVVGQRLAIPGRPLALLLPAIIVWVALALRAGVMEIDGRRLLAWTGAVVASGLALLLQTSLVMAPMISTDSWLLFMVVWLPGIARLVDRRTSTYLLAVRRVVAVLTAMGAVCIVMLSSQLAGVGYRDWVAQFLPSTLLLQDFNTTYPTEYGGSIFRSNAWVGLEPSIVSYLLGLGLLAAVLIRRPWWQLLVLALGMFSTYAGSGFIVVIIGVLVMLAFPIRTVLLRYTPPALGVVAVAVVTPIMAPLIERSQTEFFDSNSSASLRAVQGYISLWPRWSGDPAGILLGRGAGSAQRYVNDLSIADLLIPTPGRILFDYGLLAGGIVIAVLLYYYLDGPSAAIALTSFFSLWVFQPGGSQIIFALPVMLLVTFFAPRMGERIEDAPHLTVPAPPAPARDPAFIARPAEPWRRRWRAARSAVRRIARSRPG